MKIRAAVVHELHELAIETVELDPPKPYEILVKVGAAGVCHSDLHTLRGELRAVPPIVLGHEGAGIVEQVGDDVTHVKPGDHVLINWLPGCDLCSTCHAGHPTLCERIAKTTIAGWLPDGSSRLHREDDTTLKHFLSSATMAEYTVIDQSGAIPIPKDVPFEVAAVIGCAVMTGVGAVMNTAEVKAGSSAAVVGCGGVGLCAIQGCKLAGCYPIVAVDIEENKLAFARELGATHTVNSREQNPIKAVYALTNGGVDYAFDSVGAAATIKQTLALSKRYGTSTIVGMHSANEEVPIAAGELIFKNKRLLGSFAGSSKPKVDLPQLVELYRAGRLELDKLITKRYTLDQVNQAFEDMESGKVARGVIVFPV